MDSAAFARLLAIGHGRAILHLRDHDATPYREAILHACLHNTVYDRQTNGSREQYLYDLVMATGEPDFYRPQLLAAATAVPDGADGEQLLSLLRVFAAHGDTEAREHLYAAFAANVDLDKPDGAANLIELDGLAGLLTVVARVHLEEDDAWYASYLTSLAADQAGQEATTQALAELAENSPTAAVFVQLMEQEQAEALAAKTKREQSLDVPLAYPPIRQMLLDGSRRARTLLWRWGHSATDEELLQAATDLVAEDDPWRLAAYLRLFRQRRFPLPHARLVEMARDPDPRIATPAIGALVTLANADLRPLGLELLAAETGSGADLLIANIHEEDYALIERYLNEWQDLDAIHSLGISLKNIVEAHPLPAATGALTALYERGPCTFCRNHNVELLATLAPLPDWLIAECQYDANLDLRTSIQEYARDGASKSERRATP